MDIMVSERMIGQIGIETLLNPDERTDPAFMNQWYADLYTMNNRKIYVFTEVKTRYSIFAYGKGITSVAAFEPFLGDSIRAGLMRAVTALRIGCAENPPLRFFPMDDDAVRSTHDAHIAMARIYAAAQIDSSACNMEPLSQHDGRVPTLLFMAEILKLFTKPGPYMHVSQIN